MSDWFVEPREVPEALTADFHPKPFTPQHDHVGPDGSESTPPNRRRMADAMLYIPTLRNEETDEWYTYDLNDPNVYPVVADV